uniref:Uncharacterized protein n=1 Tax=Arundo donax TaxID=35708 RepID=A0A0A9BM92_ARUDO
MSAMNFTFSFDNLISVVSFTFSRVNSTILSILAYKIS